MELLALRLPRALVVRLLVSPSFPWLRSVQLNRVAATLGFQGHSGGALDWSEFVVLAFALWHGGEELPRLARSLVDAAQNGKVARKDWRRAAAPLFADQAAWAAAESAAASAAPAIVVQQQASGGGTAASSSSTTTTLPAASAATGAEWLLWSAAARSGPAVAQPDSNGVLRGLERDWLSNLFDVHWHMACYFVSRTKTTIDISTPVAGLSDASGIVACMRCWLIDAHLFLSFFPVLLLLVVCLSTTATMTVR
jgi:hypothetical protein